jgi:hypothetical protein
MDLDDTDADDTSLRAQQLSVRIIQNVTIEAFALNFRRVWDDWIRLLSQTTVSSQLSTRDLSITHAFQSIEHTITHTEGPLQWLAYLQLLNMFDTLKEMLTRERSHNPSRRERGDTDTARIINLYEESLRGELRRKKILKRRRLSKRWALLADSSPFLLLLFSKQAEAIV